MANGSGRPPTGGDYRVVRMAGAIILILGALLITAGGLLAVDLPDLRR